jgi:ElaB/YqjD/DUF883 family membrane-anchored ribosome-binding protein
MKKGNIMTATKENAEKVKDALRILNEAARDEKEEVARLLSDRYADLKSVVQDVEDAARDQTSRIGDRLRDLEQGVEMKAKESTEAVNRKVHEQPWQSMAATAVGALVLGYMMGRK